MRHRFTPSLPLAAFLLAALSAPILGCSCAVEPSVRGAVVPQGGAIRTSVGAGFRGAADVGPGASDCPTGFCPAPAAK
jgi:hypothetical protein